MIYEAQTEVTCDSCNCSLMFDLNTNDSGIRYPADNEEIEDKLRALGWVVKDERHYCLDCQPDD